MTLREQKQQAYAAMTEILDDFFAFEAAARGPEPILDPPSPSPDAAARRASGAGSAEGERSSLALAPKEECAAPGNCPQAGCPLCDPQGALAKEDA